MKTKQENIFSSKTLSYFLQLAETMNYTQAAQLLGITQPALTQQIKKLERTVGRPCFIQWVKSCTSLMQGTPCWQQHTKSTGF